MRAWQARNNLPDKPTQEDLLLGINTQLNRLVEVQSGILDVMRQRANFSPVPMEQLDSDESEDESEAGAGDEGDDPVDEET
jgi:hypothetical protein